MTTNQINDYVAAQVKLDADRKVMPLVHAIKEELAGQVRNNEKLAAVQAQVQKDNTESENRITELQKQLGVAQQEVSALSDKLSQATSEAASD